MKRGFGHYVGGAARWLLVLPVAVVVFVITNAFTAILGAWYLTGGALGFAVSVFTATFPFWILIHIFDPATVVYLTQSSLAVPLAIVAAALVAPAARFRTAIALFIVQVVLIAAQVLLEVTGYVAPEDLHARWVLGASALFGLFGGIRVVLLMHGIEHPAETESPAAVAVAAAAARIVSERPAAARRVRVVVVDDIGDTTDSIAKQIAFESDMEVVGTASDGVEAIAVTRATKRGGRS